MAKNMPGARNSRTSVKGPLLFSAVLAVIAGAAVTVFASGGSVNEPRLDLGVTAAGIAFIVSLVIAAMLSMSEKPNEEHLGKGSGINLSSAKIPGGAANAHLRQDQSQTGRDVDGSMGRDDDAGRNDARVDQEGETPGPLHPPRK